MSVKKIVILILMMLSTSSFANKFEQVSKQLLSYHIDKTKQQCQKLDPEYVEKSYLMKALSAPVEISSYLADQFLSVSEGHGIGGFGNLFIALLGGEVDFELTNIGKDLSVFCAPAVGATTDIFTISAGAKKVQTLACNKAQDYNGGFLTLDISASAELEAIPVGASINYSMGFSLSGFSKNLAEAFDSGEINQADFVNELINYDGEKFGEELGNSIDLQKNKDFQTFLNFLVGISSSLSDVSNNEHIIDPEFMIKDINQEVLNRLYTASKTVSLGNLIRKFFEHSSIKKGSNYPNLYKVLNIFSNNLSGCDAINMTGMVTVSLMPIAATLTYAYYTNMITIPSELSSKILSSSFSKHDLCQKKLAYFQLMEILLNAKTDLNSETCQKSFELEFQKSLMPRAYN